MTLAIQLVRALDAIAPQAIPTHVMDVAILHLLDAVGVGLAARAQRIAVPYRKMSADIRGDGAATIFGHPHGADAAIAAMINGGLIHSLEYDDTHTGSIVHGSSVLAAAALAAGEKLKSSGLEVITAYILGWELLVRLGEASPGCFQSEGFQITSVGGALAAAYVAARLAKLDENTTAMAMGIALSQGSGVFEFLSNGSSVKSLHPGWAAHGGIMAAQLAAHGLTGPLSSLEGRFGLFAAFARDRDAPERFERSLGTIGQEWKVADAAFKFYPCCHYIHPFIEAAKKVTSGVGLVSEIVSITCHVPAGAAGVICEPWASKQSPATSHAARWSLPIAIAAQIFDGKVSLETFDQPIPSNVVSLAKLVSWEPMKDDRFPQRFEAKLTVTLQSGRIIHERIDDVFGNVSRPPTTDDVCRKFRDNAAYSLSGSNVDSLQVAINDLAHSETLSDFAQACRGLVQ